LKLEVLSTQEQLQKPSNIMMTRISTLEFILKEDPPLLIKSIQLLHSEELLKRKKK